MRSSPLVKGAASPQAPQTMWVPSSVFHWLALHAGQRSGKVARMLSTASAMDRIVMRGGT